MSEYVCRGLEGSWLNAWLAGVGATVLDPELRLRWSDEPSPKAILCAEQGDPMERLVDAWPTRKCLAAMPLAEQWGGTPRVKRKVSVGDFRSRVRVTRSHPTAWTLSSTMTDLHVTINKEFPSGEVGHGPLDAAGPGTIKWLHYRLCKVHEAVATKSPSLDRLKTSLDGTADRVEKGGLGFDITRLASAADTNTSPWVEPVVEVLAFYALALLPTRGEGYDERRHTGPRPSLRQRGWARVKETGRRSPECFHWPAWAHPLDHHAIDALLDAWDWKRPGWSLLGVHSGWRTVSYQPRGSGDRTRAYGSRRIREPI